MKFQVRQDCQLSTANSISECFTSLDTGLDHVALTMGDMTGPDPVLMRVHSECLISDAFGSLRCDCGPQLDAALKAIAEKDGALLFTFAKKVGGLVFMQKFRPTIYKIKVLTLWMRI